MKKEECKNCGQDKVMFVPANFVLAAIKGTTNTVDPRTTHLISKEESEDFYKEKDELGSMCKDCWKDSYAKSHPSQTVQVLN